VDHPHCGDQVLLQRAGPVLRGDVEPGDRAAAGLHAADVVHQDVDSAERRVRRLGHGGGALVGSEVADRHVRVAAGSADRPGDRLGGRAAAAVDHDRRTLRGEGLSDAPTDPGAASGHQRALAGQLQVHSSLRPCQSSAMR